MDKQTIASAIWTRLFELEGADLTDQELSDELAEAVIAAARKETPESWDELLSKAAKAIDHLRESKTTRYEAEMYARAALNAAGVSELLVQIAEIREAHARIVAGQCAPDEKHCTCVPALRAQIAKLEWLATERAKRALELSLEITELEAEQETQRRLRHDDLPGSE